MVEAAGQRGKFSFDAAGKTYRNVGGVTRTWDFTIAADQTTLEFYAPMTDAAGRGPTLGDVSVVPVEGERACLERGGSRPGRGGDRKLVLAGGVAPG